MSLEDFQAAHQVQSEISRELSRLAVAFKDTGNSHMYDRLLLLAEDLTYSSKIMDDYIGKDLLDRYKDGQKALGEAISSVLHF